MTAPIREHTSRGPLGLDEIAALIARDIPGGSYVNLGIGQPTLVADHLPPVWSSTPRTACSAWVRPRSGTRSTLT
jgi:hypothetical protein